MTDRKTAIVTGSTSGIGLGVARALAGAGMNVMPNGFGKPEDIEAERSGLAAETGAEVDSSAPPAAARITGTSIPFDGGWTAH